MRSFSSILMIILVSFTETSHGHPGRLDNDKCHVDHSVGERHCHLAGRLSDSNGHSEEHYAPFDRSQYNFRSRGTKHTVGFYSEVICANAESDHLVALADAHVSGAASWPSKLKERFANDQENLVWACPSANRSKGSSGPFDYLRKNSDGLGVDGTLKDVCKFALRYKDIKAKYGLRVDDKDGRIIAECEGNVGK